MRFASTCCLDQNDNKICDDDEAKDSQKVAEESVAQPIVKEESATEESSQSEVLFEDDFSDEDTLEWEELVDDWKVQGGRYFTGMLGGSTGNVGFVIAGESDWKDYTLEYDVITKNPATNHGSVIGVYIMAQTPSPFSFSGYAASVGYDGSATLVRYANGKPNDLIRMMKEEFVLVPDKLYSVKFQKVGQDLRFKIWEKGNEEPNWQLVAQDSFYSKGYIAFDTWQTQMSIDNVKVVGE